MRGGLCMLNEVDVALMESIDKDSSLDIVDDIKEDELLEGVIENDPHELIDLCFPEV
jgi:hypothetical protein